MAALAAACGGGGGGGSNPLPQGGQGVPSASPSQSPSPGPQAVQLVSTTLDPIKSSVLTEQFFLLALNTNTPGGGTGSYVCRQNNGQTWWTTRTYSAGPPITITLATYSTSSCSPASQLTATQETITTLYSSAVEIAYLVQRTVTTYSNGSPSSTVSTSLVNDTTGIGSGSENVTQTQISQAVSGPTNINGHSLVLSQSSATTWNLSETNANLNTVTQANSSTYSYGNVGTVQGGTVTIGGSSPNLTYTYTGSHAENLYHGSVGQLSLAPLQIPTAAPYNVAFAISPDSSLYANGSAQVNQIEFDSNGNLLALNVIATTGAGYAASAVLQNGSIVGTLTLSGQAIATFTLDLNGNGTVNLSNGSTITVKNFIIVGAS
jgi:hypothetical protein